ncbi:MAG: 50S ribosomal protein L25/general stress protein Ctc [Proteobacteria bacterium]|nr:50S ribosomal protein L25/general stress protein Ctc [Pseudomonadota bacterium]
MSITLKAEKREQLGTAASRRIRNLGLIPAVIYNSAGNINLTLNSREFEAEYFKGSLTVSLIELDLAGKKTKVIAHKIELDPVSDRPVHVDFLSCDNVEAIRAKPKFSFTNQDKSLGLKKGGMLNIILRKIEVVCDNEKSIPATIEIDVGNLHIGSKIRASNLNLPAGVKLFKKSDALIASITGRGKSEEEAAPNAAPASGSAPAKVDEKKAEAKKPEAKK